MPRARADPTCSHAQAPGGHWRISGQGQVEGVWVEGTESACQDVGLGSVHESAKRG